MTFLKKLWNKFRALKKWQQVVAAIIALSLITAPFNGGSTSSTSTAKKSETNKVQTRNYPVEYLSHAVINPATVAVRFGIKNDGTMPIKPSCKIKMQDVSGTYVGYDYFDISEEIAAGQTKQVVVQLTITKEGASFVDQFTGDCSAKTSDLGSSAGQAVVISEIKNCSGNDSDGWFWSACFKADLKPMTQMDCTVLALDSSGKSVGTHKYRANTVNNGTVVSYGKDVRSYVVSNKATVESIKSFDVKCTL